MRCVHPLRHRMDTPSCAYWARIVTSAARLACGEHRAPDVSEYQAWVSDRLLRARDRVVCALVPVIGRACRADLNVLPSCATRPRPKCFQCGNPSVFEAWFWGESGAVDATVCMCTAHAFDVQCAWIVMRLPLAVYHSVRARREWQNPDRSAHLRQSMQCATVAAHHLGITPPNDGIESNAPNSK